MRQEIDTMSLRVAVTGIAGAVVWPLLWLLLLLLVAPGDTGGEATTGVGPQATIGQHSADPGCSTFCPWRAPSALSERHPELESSEERRDFLP